MKSSRPVVTYFNSHGVTGGGVLQPQESPRGTKLAERIITLNKKLDFLLPKISQNIVKIQ
jgi:hypothetical protein